MSNSAASPVIVGLVQVSEQAVTQTTIPYAAGLLQAYTQAYALNPARYLFLLPHFEWLDPEQAAARLSLAQIVGFSTYVWNVRYSLALARRLKRMHPEQLIVFGGPQVPDQAEAFLRANPWVDVCVHGPGEAIFLQLLESWPSRDWQGIPGISWLDPEGHFHTHPPPPRLQNLDTLPSPYLAGIFDPLMGRRDLNWMGIWETNRGCPFTCTFCDWGSAVAAKVTRFGQERAEAEMAWFARQRIKVLYCIDSNFGLLPRDLEIAAAVVHIRQQTGYPWVLYTQAAKNAGERVYAIQKMLLEAGLNPSATLALQSVSPAALQAVRRENISLATYTSLQQRFRRDGVPTYTDVLIGLPGETFESFVTGVGTMIAQGQHRELRIYNTYILPNAEMARPEYRQRYGIESTQVPFLTHLQPVVACDDEWQEYQELVVACHSYSRADWLRMRCFAWMTILLYYSHALKIALMMLFNLGGIPYQRSLLALCEDPLPPDCLVLAQLRAFFCRQGEAILAGQAELCQGFPDPAAARLVWMQPEFYAATLLHQSPLLKDFFRECESVLAQVAKEGSPLPAGLLQDAIRIGAASFQTHPVHQPRLELMLDYNLVECYHQVLAGEALQLRAEPRRIGIERRINGCLFSDQPVS